MSEEKTEHLTCGKSNYSVKIFTAHSTPIWPTPHDPPYPPHPYMTHPIPPLWVIISQVESFIKRLNVNWRKIHSLLLSVTCHGLGNFPLLIHIPSYTFMIFWNPRSYYFWVWIICKRLNGNCIKFIESFYVICHGLGNFPLLIHIPSYPFVNFWNPTSYYFLSLSHP